MLPSLIITFRECFEIALVLAPLAAYISRVGRKELTKYIYIGLFAGILAAILCGSLLFIGSQDLEGNGRNILLGAMQIFIAAMVVYSIVWLGRNKKATTLNIEDKYNFKLTSVSLFLLASLTVFREGMEVVLFCFPGIIANPASVVMGVGAGIAITLAFTFILYKTAFKLNLNLIFSLLALILIGIGALMFGEGLAEFFPGAAETMEKAGMMLFAVPTFYLFFKQEIKKYTKKQ